MQVSEIFLSIQGESSFVGKPTVFVRFYGCNMRCTWCDSKYAVEGRNYKTMTKEEVLKAVLGFGVQHVCLTGGEPTLQKDLPMLINLLSDEGKVTSVETDGGTDLYRFSNLSCILVMDVKLPGSGMHEKMLWKNFDHLRPGLDQVKFVILNRHDYDVAKEVMATYDLANRFEVLMSPVVAEGATWLSQHHTEHDGLRYKDLADWILEDRLPVRFNPQLHKFIWPNRHRGV